MLTLDEQTRFLIYRLLITAEVNCCVVANPPKSLVLVFPVLSTSVIADLSFDACSVNPKCCSIFTVLRRIAVGLATFLPTPSSKVCFAPEIKILSIIITKRFMNAIKGAPESLLLWKQPIISYLVQRLQDLPNRMHQIRDQHHQLKSFKNDCIIRKFIKNIHRLNSGPHLF